MAPQLINIGRAATAGIIAASAVLVAPAGAFADDSAATSRGGAHTIERSKYQTLKQQSLEPAAFDTTLATAAEPEEHILAEFNTDTGRGSRSRIQPRAVITGALIEGSSSANGFQPTDDLKSNYGCAVQCITSGVAYARGVGAKLVVKTDTPASIRIQVWNDESFYTFESHENDLTSFDALFDELEQDTVYQAAALARDSKGNLAIAEGSFKTLERHVIVSFDHAFILSSPWGSDPFEMFTWAEGQWHSEHTEQAPALEGTTLWVNEQNVHLPKVSRHLDFAVQLHQTDTGDHVCENTPVLEQPWSAQISCDAWSYATFTDGENDLDERPADATSWTEHSFERTLFHPAAFDNPGPGAFNFYVPVSIHVSYK